MSRPPEKRLRMRRKSNIDPGNARMNPKMMESLKIVDRIEVVVGGKLKCTLSVRGYESVPLREVWASDEELRSIGIADNSIATIRRPLH